MLYLNKLDDGHGEIGDIVGSMKYFLNKYILSIHRSVINVNKNLPDWVVRIYFDKSVYKRMQEIEIHKTNSSAEELIEINTFLQKFKEIIESPNVELYTYDCPKFYIIDGNASAFIRSLRYLTLIDPTVNISAIREADGYMTNLECHNLKIFSNGQHNRLFYLPWLIDSVNLINKIYMIYLLVCLQQN